MGNFEKLLFDAKSTEGKITLVASTKIHFDCDGIQFFSEAVVPAHVVEARAVALQTGCEVREGTIKLFANVLDASRG